MYQEHFGLDRPPFKITPDTSLFYEGNQRGAALDALVYAISSGEGIIKVVGEVGSGKTMLCRMLELRLPAVVDVVYIANPSLSPDNILHVIAHELELGVDTDTSKLEVMQKLQSYLLKKHEDNRQVVLFVEEAQSMPIETLEEIRLLSNLETEQSKLLQMVLFGQPELDEKLAQPHIRQLKERITHCFYLDPFTSSNTLEYLNFRLRHVGYRGPDVFNQKTANMVEKYSGGLTRRINILADKALMASYSEGGHSVTSKHVKVAATDSDFKYRFNRKPWIWGGVAVFALMLAAGLGSLLPGYLGTGEQPVTGNDSSEQHAAVSSKEIQPALPASQAEQVLKNNAEADFTEESGRLTAVADETGFSSIAESGQLTPNTASSSIAQAEKTEAVSLNHLTGSSTTTEQPALETETAVVKPEGLLEQRLLATHEWLKGASETHYSIQLFMAGTYNPEPVLNFLHKPPEMLDIERIYIYETVINGQSLYSVLYNEYISYAEARTTLNDLPAWLQDSGSYLRRISTFRGAVLSKHQA